MSEPKVHTTWAAADQCGRCHDHENSPKFEFASYWAKVRHGKPAIEVRTYRGIERNPLDVLRGSVVRYDNPTDPVAEDEWEAAQ